MTRKEALKFVLVRSLGNFLLLMSLYGVVATFGPALMYEAQYWVGQVRGVTFEVAQIEETNETQETKGHEQSNPSVSAAPTGALVSSVSSGPSFADVLSGSKEQVLVPKDTTFSIVIPKIGASARVYPNVDPSSPDEFLPILKHGVAHAKGSVFPGMNGNTYLFAHSADNWWDVGRYNAVFYLLKNLEEGDEVVVFFEDVRHEYVVDHTFIADPEDTSFITHASSVPTQQLVLQTCWPPGTTLKRQIIIAVPKKA